MNFALNTAMNTAMNTAVVEFNPVFRPVNQSKKRYRVLKGSAGSGKSMNVAQDFIVKLSDPRYAGANLLCIRKVEASHKDSTFAELTGAVFRVFGAAWQQYWTIKESPLRMRSLVTGNEIIFRGMKDAKEREKVKSINFRTGKLCFIWCEEATEMYEDDVEILDDRLRGRLPPGLYYQMTFTFNPISDKHWIKKRLWDYSDDETIKNHSTFLDNRYIDDGYKRRMERRRILDPEGYKIYGLGEWGEIGGLILTNFEITDFNRSLDAFDSRHYGQDFGYNHANAILDIGLKDGNLYICEELYVHEKDTSEIIDMANERGFEKKRMMYCDSAEPDRIKMWKKAGFRAVPVKKTQGSVRAQIDVLKGRKIFIHPSCVNTIKEIQQWKWKKDERSNTYLDVPTEIFDDAMAALRYAVEPLRRVTSFGVGRPV